MLLHYCALHIQLLVIYSDTTEDNEMQMNKRKGNLKTLRRSAKIFDTLCRASFMHENAVLESGNFAFPFAFITDWSPILVILASADLPVNQVRLLRERTSTVLISGSRFSQKLTDNVEAMTLLIQIDEDRVRFTAAGLFKVGMHLIPALTGAVVTYMVILLQN